MKESPRAVAWLVVLCGISAVLYGLTFNHRVVGSCYDDARYIVLAQALATGQGFRAIHSLGNPPEGQYPPGYPLLLAPLVRWWPHTYVPLKLLSVACTLATIVVLFFYLAMDERVRCRWPILVLVAVHPLVVFSASLVVTEMPFLLFSLLVLWLLERYREESQTVTWNSVGLGLMLIASALIRTVGLVTVAAALVWLAAQRQYKRALWIGVLVGLGMLPWFYRNVQVTGHLVSAGYQSTLQTGDAGGPPGQAEARLIPRALTHLRLYGTTLLPDLLVPVFESPRVVVLAERWKVRPFLWAGGLFVFGLVLWGWVLAWRQRFSAIELYVPLIFLTCLAWPWTGGRFLLPVLPFLYIYLLKAAEWMMQRFIPRPSDPTLQTIRRPVTLSHPLLVGLTLLIVLLGVPRNKFTVIKSLRGVENGSEGMPVAQYLAHETPRDSVVMSQYDAPVFLWSGRKTVTFPSIMEPRDVLNRVLHSPANYILAEPSAEVKGCRGYPLAVVKPILDATPSAFERVFVDSRKSIFLYRLRRQKSPTQQR